MSGRHNSSFSMAETLGLAGKGAASAGLANGGGGGQPPPTNHRSLLTMDALASRFGTPPTAQRSNGAAAAAALASDSPFQQSPESELEALSGRMAGLMSQSQEVMRLSTQVSSLDNFSQRMEQRLDGLVAAQATSNAQIEFIQRRLDSNSNSHGQNQVSTDAFKALEAKLDAMNTKIELLQRDRDHWMSSYNQLKAEQSHVSPHQHHQQQQGMAPSHSVAAMDSALNSAQLLQILASFNPAYTAAFAAQQNPQLGILSQQAPPQLPPVLPPPPPPPPPQLQPQPQAQTVNPAPVQPSGLAHYQAPPQASISHYNPPTATPKAVDVGSPSVPSFSTSADASAPAFNFNAAAMKPAGGSIFSTPPSSLATNTRAKQTSESSDHGHEEYEPNVTFEPVCPLPDLVEVTTGEEDEDVLFSQRAKLFRFDKNLGEFKERGLGDLKILKHKGTKKIRVLMRREQVHKLCANHFLLPLMELKPLQKSDKAFVWMAKDFSDGEVSDETLAARFKTPELAMDFKKVFEDSVKAMGELNGTSSKKPEEDKSKETGTKGSEHAKATGGGALFGNSTPTMGKAGGGLSFGSASHNSSPAQAEAKTGTSGTQAQSLPANVPPTAPQGFGDKFKPKPGSWDCSGCYTRVEPGTDVCPCCQTTKDGKSAQESSSASATTTTKLPFATPPSNAFSFGFGNSNKAAPTQTTTSTPASNAAPTLTAATTTTTTLSGFSFGNATSPVLSKTLSPSEEQKKAGGEGLSFGGFSFGKPPVVTKPAEEEKKKEKEEPKPVFGGFKGFSFSPSTTTTAAKSPEAAGGEKETFGSVGAGQTPSFSALAKATASSDSIFSASSSPSTAFAGKGTPLFGGAANQRAKKPSESSDHGHDEDHYEPNVNFEPVCPLPELVEVTTGEEDEDVLFSQRAKLFRWDKNLGEFKERGLGDLKILKHKETGKIRLLMRREQVHKLCANHAILPPMELKPLQKSDKAFVWVAQDFSEGAVSDETLAARFKTPQIALDFKKVFEDSVKAMGGRTGDSPKKPEEAKPLGGGGGGGSLFGNSIPATAGGLSFGSASTTPVKTEPDGEEAMAKAEADEAAVLAALTELAATGGTGLRNTPKTSAEEEEEEEEEEEKPIFQAGASLSMEPVPEGLGGASALGTFSIFLDEDVDGYRLLFDNGQGRRLMSHVLVKTSAPKAVQGSTSKAKGAKSGIVWEARDFAFTPAKQRRFSLLFASQPARDEALKHMKDGINLAKENDLSEMDPNSAADVIDLAARSIPVQPATPSFHSTQE